MNILRTSLIASALMASAFGQGFGLLPGTPKAQFFDSSGRPLASGQVFTYAAGTTTNLASYTDSTGSVANFNPVILDAGGRANIWLTAGAPYKIVLKDQFGATIWTADNVTSTGSGAVLSVFGRTGAVVAQAGDYASFYLPLSGGTVTGPILASGAPDLGSSASRFHEAWLQLADVSGAITSDATGSATAFHTSNGNFLADGNGNITGAAIGTLGSLKITGITGSTQCLHVDTTGAVTGTGSDCGSGGGGGSFLPLSGGTMTGNIQAAVANTLNIGSAAVPFGYGFFMGVVATQKVEVYDSAATDETGPAWNITASDNSFVKQIQINDDANHHMLLLSRVSGSAPVNLGAVDGDWDPFTPNARDLGRNQAWRSLYLGSSLLVNGTTVIDSSKNATVNDLTILGTCSGCPGSGSGSYLPTAGGTMTGAIQVSGSFDLGTSGSPWHEGWFQLINSSGAIQSQVVGTNPAFQTANTNFQVYGSGDISSAGSVNVTGTASTYKVQGTAVIDQNRNGFFNNLTVTGTCSGCGGGGGSGFLPLAGGQMIGPITVLGSFDLGTSSNPWHEGWFSLINASGAIQSQATGSAVAFQNANNTFIVDGSGFISSTGQLNLATASAAVKISGITAIDASRVMFPASISIGGVTRLDGSGNAVVNNLTVSGICSGCGSGGGGVTSLSAGAPLVASASTGSVALTCPTCLTGGTVLPLSGGTMVGPIIPNSALTIDFGSTTNRWNEGWFKSMDVTGAYQSEVNGSAIAFQTFNTNVQINGDGVVSAQQINVHGNTMINNGGAFVGHGVAVPGYGVSADGYNVTGGFIGQNWNLQFGSSFSINGSGSFTTLVVKGGVIVSAF